MTPASRLCIFTTLCVITFIFDISYEMTKFFFFKKSNKWEIPEICKMLREALVCFMSCANAVRVKANVQKVQRTDRQRPEHSGRWREEREGCVPSSLPMEVVLFFTPS